MLKSAVPRVKTFNIEKIGWELRYYDLFEDTFFETSGELKSYILEDFISYGSLLEKKNIRALKIYDSIQFLVQFDKNEKKILIATPQASQELAILKWHDQFYDLKGRLLDGELDSIKELKAHIDSIVSIDLQESASHIEQLTVTKNLPDFLNDPSFDVIEKKSGHLSKKLVEKISSYKSSFFEKLTDFGLDLTAKYTLFRVHLLKFLAILPSLDHDTQGKEVKRMLLEALRRLTSDSQKAKKIGKTGTDSAIPLWTYLMSQKLYWISYILPSRILAGIVRFLVRFMAKRFIAGVSIEDSKEALKNLLDSKRDFTVDQLGELVVSEKEADIYCDGVLELIRGMSAHVTPGSKNDAGILHANVSVKVSALCSDFKPQAFDYTYGMVGPRLKKILLEAQKEQVFINVDAEHIHYRDLVFEVYKKVLLETEELKDYDQTGIVLQGYLRDAYDHLQDILGLAKERSLIMPIRIVKGAYWDAETIEGDAHNYPAPQFLNKEETDLHFRQLVHEILKNSDYLQLVIASHNIQDHCFAEVLRGERFPEAPVIEHQCLHMTYEALSNGIAKMGWPVRNYVPIGSLLMGMGYLVRRIMENSSQVGFLTMMRSHKEANTFVAPSEKHRENKRKQNIVFDPQIAKLTSKFINVYPLRLYMKNQRDLLEQKIEEFKRDDLGKEYKHRFSESSKSISIKSNSDTNLEVGSIGFVNSDIAKKALQISRKEFESGEWSTGHPFHRASVLMKAATMMLLKRNELSSLIIFEGGKSITEALADVDEAIDFLNFYAREEMKLSADTRNIKSRGVILVISPWNFPLAIPCGMVAAPLVAGNTVILKSAKHTPLIAQALVDLLHEAGVPQDALINLPGEGSSVGKVLVESDEINGVVFTGSKDVGTWIFNEVSKKFRATDEGIIPNKVITEMGGKNAVIVTANAELDETVSGVLYAAFGHAGQKCSACSRVLVHESVKDRFIERLNYAVLDLKVGPAYDGSTFINPVITQGERNRLLKDIGEAIKEAKENGGQVVIDRSSEEFPGCCLGPVVIELPYEQGIKNDSYACKELFGPVLHVIPYKTNGEAIELMNCVEYGLTAGIYAQAQDDLDFFAERIEAGNIYFNRHNTGARVAIEPFGGFKMSGTGPKAGSTLYVKSFHLFSPIRNVAKETPLSIQSGPDLVFDLPSQSPYVIKTRVQHFDKAICDILNSYENIFRGARELDKEYLAAFKDWVKRNIDSYYLGTHSNRVIPGQLSYDDYRMAKKRGVLIADKSRPSIETLINFFSLLLLGSGITVITRTKESYKTWSILISKLYKSGFSKVSLKVYFASEIMVQKALNPLIWEYFLLEDEATAYENLLKEIFKVREEEFVQRYMTSIFTPYDSPTLGKWDNYLEQFINKRSFAVNTMRHGAPLEISL